MKGELEHIGSILERVLPGILEDRVLGLAASDEKVRKARREDAPSESDEIGREGAVSHV